MAISGSNFSILADVELNTANIQKQLTEAGKAVRNASADKVSLSYQAANKIFQESVEVISEMVTQVFELDGAMTEFKKVSDLSGASLDNYISKLSEMGEQVARTGKPKRQARKVRMANVL